MLRLASLTSAVLLIGCASNGDEGMTVLNNTAVTGASCMLTGDPAQPFTSHGAIHALSPAGYTLTPLIQSRITTGEEEVVDPLQRTVFLNAADVSLTLKAVSIETNGSYTVTQPNTNVGQSRVLLSGSLPPAGSVNVGFDVITPAQLRSILAASGVNLATSVLNAEVLAEVTMVGEMGGDEVLSNTFQYPISVCTSCIVVDNGACPMTITAPRKGNPCNPFQDGIVDCCSDASGSLICPGTI